MLSTDDEKFSTDDETLRLILTFRLILTKLETLAEKFADYLLLYLMFPNCKIFAQRNCSVPVRKMITSYFRGYQ